MKSSLPSPFPDPRQRPAPQETMAVGFGDDERPPGADCIDWNLTLSDDEDKADVPPDVEGLGLHAARPARELDEHPHVPGVDAGGARAPDPQDDDEEGKGDSAAAKRAADVAGVEATCGHGSVLSLYGCRHAW